MKKLILMVLLFAVTLAPGAPFGTCLAAQAKGQVEAATVVNVNQATAEQLQAVPGIGPALAERIVAYRTDHGAFSRLDQLVEVKGIGEAKLAKIQGYLTLK